MSQGDVRILGETHVYGKIIARDGINTPSLELTNVEKNKYLIVDSSGLLSPSDVFEDIGRCGFLNQTTTSLSFNSTTGEFKIQDVSGGGGWYYYISGEKCKIIGNKSIIITPPIQAGMYFIYINNNLLGDLAVSTSAWDLKDTTIIPVAVILYDNSLSPKYWLADERHSILIDRRLHYINHCTRGTQYIGGGGLSGYTLNINNNTAITFGIDNAVIADEDIIINIPFLTDGNQYVIFYRSAVGVWKWKYSSAPFSYDTGSSYIDYDNNGVMTSGSNGNYYNTYLIFTNISGDARFIIISGRSQFSSLSTALSEDPSSFDFSGLSINEYIIMYQLTWYAQSGNSTYGKVRLISSPKILNISSRSAVSVTTAIHNSLTGLQGGLLNQYYHLDSEQYSYLNSLNLSYNYIGSNSIQTNSITPTILVSFSGSEYNCGKFIISAKCLNEIHSSEILLVYDGANIFYQEYSTVKTSNLLYSISTNINQTNIELLVTSGSSNITNYKISYILNKV